MKIILILLIPFTIFCQSNQAETYNQGEGVDAFLIVNANKLSIRSEPNIESNRLGIVNEGELVKVLDRRSANKYIVTIDGIMSTWKKIEYKNIIGYMFGGYLSCCPIFKPNNRWNKKYQLSYEGVLASSAIGPSENLKWYGLYSREDGEYIEEIIAKMEYIQHEHEVLIKVITNKQEQSKWLLGTNDKVNLGKVGIPMGSFANQLINHNQKIPIPFYIDNCRLYTNLYLEGYSPDSQNHRSCNYSYEIALKDIKNYGLRIYSFDDFNCYDSSRHQSLMWYGDINGDLMPDFIFNQLTTYASFDKLYISEKLENKTQYKKVN